MSKKVNAKSEGNARSETNAKDYSSLVKFLQILTGVILIICVIIGIYLINKYNIKVSNIKNLSENFAGVTTLNIALVLIGIAVVKSFVLVFPPAVLLSISAYTLPNFAVALLVNIVSIVLSLIIPFFLGKFTGAGMVETLKAKFKPVKKIDDFVGVNEVKMTAIIKFSGIMPGDLSSLLFGSMNLSFKNYMAGAVLGNLPLILAYTLFGTLLKNVGEKPFVVAIPVAIIILFLLIAGVLVKKTVKKQGE